ncbi:uncharacterized protein ACJ7VT_008086 [Polymixia lowei]
MACMHRELPSWMAMKEEEKVKEKKSLNSRKTRVVRTTFYCMNEKELVEAALSYLSDDTCGDAASLDQQVKKDKVMNIVRKKLANTKKMGESTTETLEESSNSDGQERTCVSETDLDIAEMETVPYTSSPQHQQTEGQVSRVARDHRGLVDAGLEAEKILEHSQTPAAANEDDAFQLVRDIFFT